MFEDKCVWSALYPISNHSHIRQLQFATHAFSQQVLQQAVQISICQCDPLSIRHFLPERSRLANQKLRRSREWAGNKARREVALNPSIK